MADREHIERHWPQLAALTRVLEALPSDVSVPGTTATPAAGAGTQSVASLIAELSEYQQRGGKVPWQ